MSEILIREQIEIERQRDAFARLEKINALERLYAVLQTRFEALIDTLKEAVSDEDLKELKRELEEEMKQQIGHICDHFDGRIAQQSKDFESTFRGMLTELRMQNASDALESRNAQLADIRRMRGQILWWGFGVGGAIITSVISAIIIGLLGGH